MIRLLKHQLHNIKHTRKHSVDDNTELPELIKQVA